MIKKKLAFTLAEVLIALAVIGSVAALLIPKLIYGLNAKQAKSRYNTAYSMIAEAITKMDADDIALKSVNYGSVADFYTVFEPYFKVIQKCGTTLCNPTPAYTGIESEGGFLANNNMFVFLEDGASIATDILTSEGQSAEDIPDHVIVISVDINGNRKNPNLRGKDVFSFELQGEDLVPIGHPDSLISGTCPYGTNANVSLNLKNTISCSYNAATDEDYFMKLHQGH